MVEFEGEIDWEQPEESEANGQSFRIITVC